MVLPDVAEDRTSVNISEVQTGLLISLITLKHSVDLKTHNIRVVNLNFIQGPAEDYSRKITIQLVLRKLLQRSRGEASLYMIFG